MNGWRRLARVAWIVSRQRLDTLLDDAVQDGHALPLSVRLAFRLSPARLLPRGDRARGARLRLAFEELGPVFVKFGQLLSTRRDLLPADVADELARLQDQVPAFPGSEARALIEAALEQPLDAVFSTFDPTPMASASVAQVHAAQLLDGTDVVVKVVRPGIGRIIREDLALLHQLAELLERHAADARRLHLREVIDDYERTILQELDLRREAQNTVRLRINFAGSPLLYVPRIQPHLTRSNMLVMERIFAVPIGDIATLRARGTDFRLLAERGVETFFTQVFEHNFFHADMHPGNIFVDVTNPADPHYIAIDCAIVGSLTAEDQDYLARNLLAFFNRDYAEVARLHLESGWIPDTTDPAEFEQVIRTLCEPIFARPLSEISFGVFLLQLFDTARDFEMEIQPQLVLLQKTLLYIEGLGRQLYPELDLWATAKPFMERWVAARVGPVAALRALTEHAPEIISRLPELPLTLARSGSQLKRLERRIARQSEALDALINRLERSERRRQRQLLGGLTLLLVLLCLLWARQAPAGTDQQPLRHTGTIAAWKSSTH